MGFPGDSAGKNPPAAQGDASSIPGSGSSPSEGIGYPLQYSWVSLIAQLVKNLPAMQETLVQFLGREGIGYPLWYSWASLVAQLVKNPPAVWKSWFWSLG